VTGPARSRSGSTRPVHYVVDDDNNPKGGDVFRQLTEELLDLRVTEKGYGTALYAADEDEGGGGTCCSCSSCTLCISLCCTI
jgi:hypothetical protein